MRSNFLCISIFFAGLPFYSSAQSAFNGLYIGAAVGGSVLTTQQQTSSQIVVDFPADILGNRVRTTVPNSLGANLNDDSVVGTFFAGYGHGFDHLYLGAEAFVSLSGSKLNDAGSSSTEQFLQFNNQLYSVNNSWTSTATFTQCQYGLDIRPGILIKSDMLVYGRAGFARTTVNLSSSLQGTMLYTVSQSQSNNNFTLTSITNTQKTLLRLGGGFEYHINPKYSIRLDYVHERYGKINAVGESSKAITSSIGTLGYRLNDGTLQATMNTALQSISSNAVAVGLSYYF